MEPAAKQRRTHALAGLGRFRGVSANTVDEILNRLKAAPELLDAKLLEQLLTRLLSIAPCPSRYVKFFLFFFLTTQALFLALASQLGKA